MTALDLFLFGLALAGTLLVCGLVLLLLRCCWLYLTGLREPR